jgi:amidophosphoribosyltransferase
MGHVRYSTAGESRLANAQPIVIDSVHGQLAVGHNGNIVNASELRDALVRTGAIFQATTDTEVVVHLFARSREATAEAAIIDALSQVRGAYSFVMMTNDRLIAARDPHGFRPLAIGRRGDAWVICSETCAMDLIGATYLRDVEPGEIVVASAHGLRSIKTVRRGAAAAAVHLRARLFLATRQLRVWRERERDAHRVRPPAGQRIGRSCGCHRAHP